LPNNHIIFNIGPVSARTYPDFSGEECFQKPQGTVIYVFEEPLIYPAPLHCPTSHHTPTSAISVELAHACGKDIGKL